jgi:hypothetical protein
MKKLLFCLSAIAMSFTVAAQTNWSSNSSTTTTSTSVGIGTTSVYSMLQVQGSDVGPNNIFNGDDVAVLEGYNAILQLYGHNTSSLSFANGINSTTGLRSQANLTYTQQYDVLQYLNKSGEAFRIMTNGNFGIGNFSNVSSPMATLQVRNANYWSKMAISGPNSQLIQFFKEDASGGQQQDASGKIINTWVAGQSDDNKFAINNRNYLDGTEEFVIAANGNVGVGITNPSAKLHVNGSLRFAGLATTPNTGYVLTSTDALGNATWSAPLWTKNVTTSDISFSGGKIGMGTITPQTSLHITDAQAVITLTSTGTSCGSPTGPGTCYSPGIYFETGPANQYYGNKYYIGSSTTYNMGFEIKNSSIPTAAGIKLTYGSASDGMGNHVYIGGAIF